ncbi:hypothetical protein KR215_004884, partial [Drosophila sulfurigaster]
GLGKTNWLMHDIEVTESKPIKQRHYAVSPAIEKLMYDELDRMLALGVIEESESPWSSPVVIVRKPGKVCLCLDSRKVNDITVKNAYPMPLIDGILNKDDIDVPIAFMSRKLNRCQRNYSVTEKECLAAIMCVKFRAYVEGHEFAIHTDHASLKWLMSQTDFCSRLARWALKLQGFAFKIVHRKGSQNIFPDALSRVHTEDLSSLGVDTLIDLQSEQFESKEYQELKDKIKTNPTQLPEVKVIDKYIY